MGGIAASRWVGGRLFLFVDVCGVVAAWRKITGILRDKGVKQTDTATAALLQRVQEQFITDIETAENAVRKMQKALSAAMKAETQNKNAAETGDVMFNKKNNTKIESNPPLSGSSETTEGEVRTIKSKGTVASNLGIELSLPRISESVNRALVVFSGSFHWQNRV
ncbi:MAG: hypothetical protein ACI4V3_02960 [Faecousia sp.]